MRLKTRARAGGIAAATIAASAAAALWLIPTGAQAVPESRPAPPPMSMTAGPTQATQIAAARQATAKYATNLARAKADGYQIITMMMPNMGYHFMNPAITKFDARKPQILVYEHTGKTWQLGALEWVFTRMPKTPPLPNATFGLFPAACHYQDGTFVADQHASTCPKTASDTGSKFNFWHPDLITMHEWVWYPNPAGLFSSTNPQVAPFNGG